MPLFFNPHTFRRFHISRLLKAVVCLIVATCLTAFQTNAESHVSQADLSEAAAQYKLGEDAYQANDWDQAYIYYKRAAELSDDIEYLDAYANITWRLKKGPEALEIQQHLVDLTKAEYGAESAEYARRINELALVLGDQGRLGEAEELLIQAIEISRKTIGEDDPNYAIRLNNLAGMYHEQGRFAEAETLYTQVLDISRKTIGEEHPSYAFRLNNLAGALQAQGQFAEAEKLYIQALEIGRKAIGQDHPDYAALLNNYAHVLHEQGRLSEAKALYAQALVIFRAALPADHPNIVFIQQQLEILSKP